MRSGPARRSAWLGTSVAIALSGFLSEVPRVFAAQGICIPQIHARLKVKTYAMAAAGVAVTAVALGAYGEQRFGTLPDGREQVRIPPWPSATGRLRSSRFGLQRIASPFFERDTAPAMSQENVEILRVFIEDFLGGTSERDRESMLTRLAELWDPEIELDASESQVLDLSGVYRGRSAVGRFWEEWLAAWETNRFEYQLVDAGDRVVQLFDLRMRGRTTGIELHFGKIAWVYKLRDGLVVHQKLYMSHSEALEAVGLSE